MADLIKIKTGAIDKLAQKDKSDEPVVKLDKGTIYFAVDPANMKGRVVYDAPDGKGGVARIVMSEEYKAVTTNSGDLGLMTGEDKNKLSQMRIYSAGTNIDISETGVISSSDSWYSINNIKVAKGSFTQQTTAGTYPAGYPYRAAVANTKITANDVVIISLDQASSETNIMSSVTESYKGGVYIYASQVPDADIVINSLMLYRDDKLDLK